MALPASPLRFALRFAVLFAVFAVALQLGRGTAVERLVVDQAVLAPSGYVINRLDPSAGVTRIEGHSLVSPASRLNVVRGCEGIETLLLLAAAVLAFPARWRERLCGLALGGAAAWLASILRLVALHFVLRYRPDLWDALHGFIAPLLPVAVLTLFFLWWSARAAPQPVVPRAA